MADSAEGSATSHVLVPVNAIHANPLTGVPNDNNGGEGGDRSERGNNNVDGNGGGKDSAHNKAETPLERY